jgi:hypothetical protein
MMETTSLFEQNTLVASQAAGNAQQTWMCGPSAPVIWPNEVHVWRARLDVPVVMDF